jgi:hypothetical protein
LIVSDPAAKSRPNPLHVRLRTQRAGRIVSSLDGVGIPGHQDAGLLPSKSFQIIDSRNFTTASSEREHGSVDMFENPGDFMRRLRGIERRRLGRGGRAHDKRMPAEAENRQLSIARHKDVSICHKRPPTVRHHDQQRSRESDFSRPCPDQKIDGPNQLWVADITYITIETGFVYLAVILDAWSRRVVGYARERDPTKGCIHHSDRGSQYGVGRLPKADHRTWPRWLHEPPRQSLR